MRPEDLARADDLFHAALERPHAERRAFLADACRDAPELAAQIEQLLASHDEAVGYFEGLAGEIASTTELELNAREPLRVGPYQTLRVLGRGGMGTVFLAERVDGQFTQQVALKVIRLGMDTAGVHRRFLAERQIVARLQHPNIARLLDGGVTDDGRPYFVMEYVDGQPLTAYCASRSLSIDRRLDVLLDVAEAVQYAHRNLVVHRDLKPGNILVTADGTVKLVDFGIAKLLTADAEDGAGGRASDTTTGERVLSVPYAAPEQLLGAPITTATDVYGLGVVLYELLAGRRPFEASRGGPHEIERAILEHEPAPPSAVADRAVRRRLAGDLDTICLMALRKEPERRYPTAEQLADDIRRHRRGLPVAARPDTVRYRAAKFVRRHRVGVGATLVVVLLTLALAAATMVQSARTARERDKANRVADLLVRLFEVADPGETRGASITAREVLDRGVQRIQTEGALASDPDVKASLLAVMGRVYQNLGLYARATPLLQQSLTLNRATRGDADREVAAGMTTLGEVLRLGGDYKAAEPVLRDALSLNEQVHGRDEPETARTLNNLSKLLYARGKNDEAEQAARRSLEINRARLGPGSVELAESLTNLGAALFAKGDDPGAEPLFRDALAIRRQALGNDHPLVPAALNNLAALLSRKGDYAAAEAAHRESLEIYRRLFGSEHPRVATGLNNLALVLFARKDYAGAEPLFRESLAMRRKLLDPSHAETAQSLANLGLLLQTTSKLDESEHVYREALDIRRRALGDNHVLVQQTINNLGLLMMAKNQPAAAEALFRQALDSLRASLGPDHPLVATGLHNLATSRVAQQDPQGAAAMFEEALAIRRRKLPAGHPDTALTQTKLAETNALLAKR